MSYGTPLATAAPLVDSGSGVVGTSGRAAREDHAHPLTTHIPFGACRTVSTTQTLTNTEGYIRVPSGNAAITLTMPASPANGHCIVCDNLSSNSVTWSPNTNQTLMQPNSNATSTSYQVSGGVRIIWLYSSSDRIWKA